MSARLETAPDGQFRLAGELSADSVPALAHRGADLFKGDGPVDVDLSGVERSDSVGVALLVEWMVEAHRREREIRYLNIPAQMLSIARVSSLDHVLPLIRD